MVGAQGLGGWRDTGGDAGGWETAEARGACGEGRVSGPQVESRGAEFRGDDDGIESG